MAAQPDMPTFKLVVIGNGGPSTTNFVRLYLTGQFETYYVGAQEVKVHPLVFHTTQGAICFNIWNVSGQEEFGKLDDYFHQGQCALVMLDVGSRVTSMRVPSWRRDLARICGGIPIVQCGNKNVIDNRKRKDPSLAFQKRNNENLKYYDTLAESEDAFENPFLWLAQHLMDDRSLEFVAMPPLQPPEVYMDPNWQQQIEGELEEAQNIPLPEEDPDLQIVPMPSPQPPEVDMGPDWQKDITEAEKEEARNIPLPENDEDF